MTSARPAGPTAVPGEQVVCEMFIAGEWTPAASGETFAASSPANGALIGSVAQGDRGDAQRAIEAARNAAAGWARLSAFERAAKMHAVGDLIESRRPKIFWARRLAELRMTRDMRGYNVFWARCLGRRQG